MESLVSIFAPLLFFLFLSFCVGFLEERGVSFVVRKNVSRFVYQCKSLGTDCEH